MEKKKKPCKYVQDLEKFFGSEFSTDQLIQAVEELNIIAGKDAAKPNATKTEPKTVALGVLAAYKIRELYNNEYFHEQNSKLNYYAQENQRNQSYQIGMEIVKGKYNSMQEAIFAYEKNL